MDFDRIVVGGGLFGSYSAWVLARRGYRWHSSNATPTLMQRATLVNQARLHSGLHYPRSLLTAAESLRHYQSFNAAFPDVVREDFTKVYAVSRDQSKTSAAGFRRFLDRLGPAGRGGRPRAVVPPRGRRAGREGPGGILRRSTAARVMERLDGRTGGHDMTGHRRSPAGEARESGVDLRCPPVRRVTAGGVVLATYAGLNPLRRSLGLDPLRLKHELTEVLLCRVGDPYRNLGITVMDGPFWSFMPFGWTDLVSLTSVSLTPVMADP